MNNPQNILSFLNNSASVYFINLDLEGRYVYVNNLFRKIFGYKEYEILEKSFKETIFPEDVEDFEYTIRDTLTRPNESFVIDLRKPRADGSLFWTRWEFSAVTNGEGKAAGVRGVGTDITERKRAEFERRKTQEYLQSILNNTDESFVLIDPDLNILSYNVAASKSVFEIFGVHLKKGLPILMFVDDGEYERAEGVYRKALEGKQYEIETRKGLKTGGERVLSSTIKPVYTDSGDLQGVMITSRDVTARKHAEEQLVRNERHFRALIENSADALIIVTPDGQFRDVSPSAKRILGYSEQELHGIKKAELVHPEDLQVIRYAFLDVIRTPDAIQTIEVRIKVASGGFIWLHATLHNLLHERSIGGVVINFNDITERKTIEKALQDSEEKYRFLFYINPQPMWIYDTETFQFIEVNLSAIRHYGYSHEEFLSMTLMDIRPKEDIEKLRRKLTHINVNRGLSHSQEVWRHLKKSGELIYVEIKSHSIEYTGRSAVIVSVNDITTKVKAEQDLIRSNERFQYAVKATSEAIWEWDIVTGEMYIADGYTKMLGWDIGPNRKFEDRFEYLHPDERDAVVANLNAALEDPDREMWQYEYRYRKPDGSYAYVADRGWILRDEDGKPVKVVGSLKDMTQSKQFEQELIKSNERFEFAGKATSDAIWDADLINDSIHWGEGFHTLFGYEISDDAEGKTWMDHIHPDDLERVVREHYRVINETNETFWQDEYRFLRKDGSIAYVTDKGLIMRDENGKAFRIIGAMQDITERKKAEERLAEERHLLRTLVDHLPDAVYVKDTQFRHIMNNAASVATIGVGSEEETIGKTVFDFFDKETAERFTEQERRILETRKPIINVEELIITPQGEEQWLLTTKVPLIDENDELIGIVGISRNISERKKILEDLRESNERFSIVSRATNDAIYDWNIKENHLFWNEALSSIFDLKDIEIKDTYEWWMQHIHPDDQPGVVKNLQYHIDNKIDHWQYEYRFLGGDGTYKYVYDRGYILNDSNGIPYRMIGAMMDITQRKKLEDALANHMVNRQRQITEATIQGQEKERSEIGRELHDNINQILTTTKLYIDMAINDEEIREELLNKSYSNVSRAIEEIRVLSKSLVPPSLKDIGLREAITELVDNLNIAQKVPIRLKSSGVRKAQIASNIKLMVYRIIQEQLNNILKHARASEAEIKLVVSEKMLNITVADNGVGFDPKKKAKGIGLNNIASRAELHNGRVDIVSAPGKGCTLKVAIPI